jgi:hypothetical protein
MEVGQGQNWGSSAKRKIKWSVVQKSLGSPGTNDTICLALSFICVYVIYLLLLLVLTL